MTLSSLIQRLEEATGPDRRLDGDIAQALGQVPSWCTYRSEQQPSLWNDGRPGLRAREWCAPHYTKSLDVSLSLLERCLPGEFIELDGPRKYLNIPTPVPGRWRAEVAGKVGWGATPAFALILAVLRVVEGRHE